MSKLLPVWLAAGMLLLSGNGLADSLKTDKQKLSYALGQMAVMSMKLEGAELDNEMVLRAVKDALEGKPPLMSRAEVFDAINRNRARRSQRMQIEAQKNQAEGNLFLEANRKKPGVQVMDSGLQYTVIKEGDGPVPGKNDIVEAHYRGMLIDGTLFDSSYGHGKPAVFRVDKVIAGWSEALQHMHVGAKWKLFIPSDLAYGPKGLGDRIPPNAALIFEVELLAIKSDGKGG